MKKSDKNNIKKFENLKIERSQLSKIKGGDDGVITEDLIIT